MAYLPDYLNQLKILTKPDAPTSSRNEEQPPVLDVLGSKAASMQQKQLVRLSSRAALMQLEAAVRRSP